MQGDSGKVGYKAHDDKCSQWKTDWNIEQLKTVLECCIILTICKHSNNMDQ